MSSAFLVAAREGAVHVVRRPLRSALEAVSCAVAIAVAVNVISVTRGLDAQVRADIGKLGRLTIDVGRSGVIRPGAARASFGTEEVGRIRDAVRGLSARVVPIRQAIASAHGDAAISRLSVAGVGPDYPASLDLPLVAGRWFSAEDPVGSACVLDESVAHALFPGRDPAQVVGRPVAIEGERPLSTRVVGVLGDPLTYRSLFDAFDEGSGTRTLSAALLVFRNAYVPLEALPGDDLTDVVVTLPDERRHAEALARLRAIVPEDPTAAVTLFDRKQWMDMLGATSRTGALLGNVVWVIVVLVAAVMISTLNLAGVRERYDEIAVRRCEGARRGHVATQVGVEGVLVALAGGCLGLPLGYVASAVLSRLVDFPFLFDWRHAVAGTGIAAVLGLGASVLPARRAASLEPARVLSRRLR
jgi:putative ABC transport system permease protein